MTAAEKLRMRELEDALEGAKQTIQFLHSCLTNPLFEYAYPDMTRKELERICELVPDREYCVHSKIDINCSACREHIERDKELEELKRKANV